ncbi:MAG: 2-hydroxyacyl-CoA dehydratase [Myxococcales bacterium]|nr:2-hydroxyacyl-CoA dehydratase [Myxococcales bacterium]MBK7194818.1 2-hydroxyacyl-CoA dehydratase [Myxococcales bacterium]MBP6849106.1 2-hydroxyacyl-CoA dehydratase [Kofleriaceae bacterium]
MTTTQPTIDDLVADLEARFDDVDLGHVRAWKDGAPHRLAIGCLPVFAPREVIWAAGALPVFVRGAGDRIETIRGDAYYQSYICHLPRSTLELGLLGHLDGLDGMVFPNTCDVIRNLSGMWQTSFPQHLVRFLDPPQTAEPASAAAYLHHELSTLFRDLCAHNGVEPEAARLHLAIADYAAANAVMRELAAARQREPWNLPVDEVYLLKRAADSMPPGDWADLARRYLAAAAARGRKPEDRIRVCLVGSFCEQPPRALLRAAEKAGCYIIDDDLTLGVEPNGPDPLLGDDGDPMAAIVAAWLRTTRPSAVRYDEHGTAGRILAERVAAVGADGVVFAAPSFCDPALLDQPRLTRVLDQRNIPYTSFKYAENTGQFQAIREQAGTFADSVKLWGTA